MASTTPSCWTRSAGRATAEPGRDRGRHRTVRPGHLQHHPPAAGRRSGPRSRPAEGRRPRQTPHPARTRTHRPVRRRRAPRSGSSHDGRARSDRPGRRPATDRDAASDDPDVLIAGIAATVEQVIAEAGAPRERVVGVGHRRARADRRRAWRRGRPAEPRCLAPRPAARRPACAHRPSGPAGQGRHRGGLGREVGRWAERPRQLRLLLPRNRRRCRPGDRRRSGSGFEQQRRRDRPCDRRSRTVRSATADAAAASARRASRATWSSRRVQAGVLAQGIDLDDRHAVDVGFAALCSTRPPPVRAWRGTRRHAGGPDRQGGRGHREPARPRARRLRRSALGPARPVLRRAVRAALVERFLVRSVHPFAVTGTALGADVGAVGAASLVLDHTFSPNPSVLLLGPAESTPPAVAGSAER